MTKTRILIAPLLLLLPAVAGASHPESREMARVQVLAHELERAARHVHRAAERGAHHGDYMEERGLRRLHELEDRARHFHRQVERYVQNPYHTEADFRALVRAYYRAQEGIGWLHAYRHILRDFRRVDSLMEELLFYYDYDEHAYDRRRGRGHWRRHRPRIFFRWDWWN